MQQQTAPRRWLLSLPFAIFFILFLSLGRWQLQRMEEKQSLFAQFESGALITVPFSRVDPQAVQRYQHVIATGRYRSDRQVLLDNMTHQGRVGYRVMTPLVGTDESTVLVDRGWVAAEKTRDRLPQIAVSEQLRGLSGKLDRPPQAGIKLGSPSGGEWPLVMNYPSLEELEAVYGQRLFPWIILLDPDQPDGFVREWRPATFGPERHLGYAVTWFALAATVLIAYFIVFFRRRKS